MMDTETFAVIISITIALVFISMLGHFESLVGAFREFLQKRKRARELDRLPDTGTIVHNARERRE